MSSKNPLLSLALIIFGAAFLLIYPLSIFWASGWAWHSGGPMASDYFLMIVVVWVERATKLRSHAKGTHQV